MLKKLLYFLLLATGISNANAACNARFMNPITDINWLNALPIVVANAPLGATPQSPLIFEPAVCMCPSHIPPFPIVPGVGSTYWDPTLVVETVHDPGCLLTLGVNNALPMFATLQGAAQPGSKNKGKSSTRIQIHAYQYPLFEYMKLTDLACSNVPQIDIAYLTEVDPIWQNDLWANILNPEAILYANPISQAACAADAVAATIGFPLDAMSWCAGSWGSIYPFSGNPNAMESDAQAHALIVAKYLARNSRVGLQWTTIGPTALCTNHPNPVLVKNQFRLDALIPLNLPFAPINIGKSQTLWSMTPPANWPLNQNSAWFVWQAKQCCVRT